jgi:hypothetical protein
VKNNVENRPNFIIIGAMNTGTTSLHKYLSYHNDIFMSSPKELDFFNIDNNYNKGIAYYKSFFNSSKKRKGEASPNYTKTNSDVVAKRMSKDFPNIKLIYIVRDPVDRFLSQCRYHNLDPNAMYKDYFGEKSFKYDIMISGKYGWHYERFLKYFKKEQILIIHNQDLLNSRRPTIEQVLKFLEVSGKGYDFTKIEFKEHTLTDKDIPSKSIVFLNNLSVYKILKKWVGHNSKIKQLYRGIMYSKPQKVEFKPELKNKLKDYYRSDIEKLEYLTNTSFDDWK